MTLALVPPLQGLLGTLVVAGLIAGLVARLVLPAARPALEEICRSPQRGVFWSRLLGIALVLAILLGTVLGYVSGGRFLLFEVPEEPAGALRDCARMLRLAVQLGALVLVAATVAMAVMTRVVRHPEAVDGESTE